MHTDFLKRILKVKKSSLNVMLYGDLGRVPLSIGIKKRAVGFCYDMILSKDKLSSIIHFMMLFIILIDITGYILFNPYLMNVDLAIFGKVSLLMVQNQCCFPD